MEEKIAWFEKLYDDHAEAIWRHLYMRLGDPERSQELMQEVFARTWDYVRSGKSIAYERAFLYKLARNLFINEIRTDKKARSLDELQEGGFDVQDTRAHSDTGAHIQELLAHLSGLPDQYQEVLVMRYIDDLQVKEIAKLIGKGETAVSMRIKRGIEALQKAYNIHKT